MTEIKLKHRRVNFKRLSAFGFCERAGGYEYTTDIAGAQMTLTLRIEKSGRLFSEVTDKDTGEEYILHRIEEAIGSFVGQVRLELEDTVEKVSAACFEPEIFKSPVTKAVIAYCLKRYGDSPEHLWEKAPDNAILRRQDNKKWYAAILTLKRSKLGLEGDGEVEIVDLRLPPEKIEETVDGIKYFPGYHMNKKHWITVCLDGSVDKKEIYARIDESYMLAKK